jgi:AraC-like DNA-binding protein
MAKRLVIEINFRIEQKEVCDQLLVQIKALIGNLPNSIEQVNAIDDFGTQHCSFVTGNLRKANNDIGVDKVSFEMSESGSQHDFLTKCFQYIVDHANRENFNLPKLAEGLNVSKATFYRKIKMITGYSPLEFVTKIKMQIAYDLLRTKKYSVSEVAWKCGYNSVKHFSKIFYRTFNSYPSKVDLESGFQQNQRLGSKGENVQ